MNWAYDSDRMKEVHFANYCESCQHFKTVETDDPCNDCLTAPARPNSHRPLNYKEKK